MRERKGLNESDTPNMEVGYVLSYVDFFTCVQQRG